MLSNEEFDKRVEKFLSLPDFAWQGFVTADPVEAAEMLVALLETVRKASETIKELSQIIKDLRRMTPQLSSETTNKLRSFLNNQIELVAKEKDNAKKEND